MLVLKKPHKKTMELLARFKAQTDSLRPASFIFQVPVSEGILLHNTLTTELLFLQPDEATDFFTSPYAAKHWFSVPGITSEIELVQTVRDALIAIDKVSHSICDFFYLIFTTTCCNARCPYCYEIGHHHNTSMSRETAEKTADFIIQRSYPGQRLRLDWMGGEPLLNTAVIDLICDRVRASGTPFSSGMATNAYLMTEDLLRKTKDRWNLSLVQITLDGTEEKYNSTKRYVGVNTEKSSPYRRIMDNIEAAIRLGISLEIHLNMTPENCDDIIDVAKELYRRFGKTDLILVKVVLLNQRLFDETNRRSDADEKLLFERCCAMIDLLDEYGYSVPMIPYKIRLYHCAPAADAKLGIMTDGHICWCDEVLDQHPLGTVDSQMLDEDEIAFYNRKMQDLEECKGCPFYPKCIRLECCHTDVPWCTEQYRGLEAYKLQKAMLNAYRDYLAQALPHAPGKGDKYETLLRYWDMQFRDSDNSPVIPAELISAASSLSGSTFVLDYGCGNGWAGLAAADAGAESVLCFDTSKEAVRIVAQAAAARGLSGKVHSTSGDADWLSTQEDNSFDGCFCGNVLDVIPAEAASFVLGELSRVLKQGSPIVVTTNVYLRPENNPKGAYTILNGNEVYIDGVLRMVSRTTEEWIALFSPFFDVERVDHDAKGKPNKINRRIFYLRAK